MSTDPTSDRADGAASMDGHAAVVPRSPEEKERYAAIRRGAERERAAAEGLPRPNDIRVAQAWSSLAAEAFMRLAENVRDYPIFLMDTDGVIIFWGEGARLMKWWSKEQAEGAHPRMLYKVTRDLTARHAADAHLQAASVAAEAARADAVAASAAKSGFLATISHEIRTPLNAILGYHELLALEIDGPLTPAQRDNLERARKSVRHLLGLVNEVLDFSRIDAEREPVSRATFQVGEAVRGALELVLPQARSTPLTITDAVSGYAAGLSAWGDEQRVRQILVNLLANAVKFATPRGGDPGRVTISAGAAKEPAADVQATGDGPWVFIRIEDSGRGIQPEQLRTVFEPSVQGDMTLTREHGGTGLGLAISRRLARLMGGDLTVRSEPGLGSAFLLWLPAAPIESLATGGLRGHGPGSSEHDREASPAPDEDTVQLRPTTLRTIGDVILAELEEIMREFVGRVRSDPEMASAHEVDSSVLEDHFATFLADVATTLAAVTLDDNAPNAQVRDGTAIQRVVAQRHGGQRARLGWTEREVRREFVLLEETVAEAVRRRLSRGVATPSAESGAGEAGRAAVVLHQALRIAEGWSLESFRQHRPLAEAGRESS